MPRVNLEDDAFSDPRIMGLGRDLKEWDADFAKGLGFMAMVWHTSQAKAIIVASREQLDAWFFDGCTDMLVKRKLLLPVGENQFEIVGNRNQVERLKEWHEKKSAAGKKGAANRWNKNGSAMANDGTAMANDSRRMAGAKQTHGSAMAVPSKNEKIDSSAIAALWQPHSSAMANDGTPSSLLLAPTTKIPNTNTVHKNSAQNGTAIANDSTCHAGAIQGACSAPLAVAADAAPPTVVDQKIDLAFEAPQATETGPTHMLAPIATEKAAKRPKTVKPAVSGAATEVGTPGTRVLEKFKVEMQQKWAQPVLPNKMNRTHAKQLVELVGEDTAMLLVERYAGSREAWYVKTGHDLRYLVKDYNRFLFEVSTNRRVNKDFVDRMQQAENNDEAVHVARVDPIRNILLDDADDWQREQLEAQKLLNGSNDVF